MTPTRVACASDETPGSTHEASGATADWSGWRPDLHATLMFVVRDAEILLIHKKRGIGAGKLNGAGGKVDPGETVEQAAVREFEEELLARPVAPRKLGEVAFDVIDDVSILIHVFRSDDLEGDPSETDEARPVWAPVDAIPYDQMWEDDRRWLPLLLENKRFEARAQFRGDAMLSCEVVEIEPQPASR